MTATERAAIIGYLTGKGWTRLSDLRAACKEAEFLAAHGVGAVNTSKDPDCVANAQRNLDECIRIQKILRAAIAKAGGAA